MHCTVVLPSCFRDLRNNSLDGPIPDFLGKLPNLSDLRDNRFTGDVLQSITGNKQLKYMIGNKGMNQSRGERLALIVGLAVGLPIFLVFVIFLVYFLVRKQKTLTQGQVTEVEVGGGQPQEGMVSTTLSTEALFRPSSLAIEHTSSMSNGDGVATDPGSSHIHHLPLENDDPGSMSTVEETSMDANAGSVYYHTPFVQMIDEEELNDLLRQHRQN
ncbi:Uncharacterized protein TCM_041932 [Theobroma cacao]|uniref:Uncharacterized protein n=1 Tax=Theobroma cacao TaxID=3641 RepID=A0A061GWJ3_THECC|nr:Uncharacterized protein TCM_041932 [Theobroma cacao]